MNLKKFRIIIIGTLTIIVILLVIWIIIGVCSESTEEETLQTSISLSKVNGTSQEILDEVMLKAKEYCIDKDLVAVVARFEGYTNIIKKDGEIVYSFYQYINDNCEGGNISVADIYIDTEKVTIDQIHTFKGAGKPYMINDQKLDTLNWNLDYTDIIEVLISSGKLDDLQDVTELVLEIKFFTVNREGDNINIADVCLYNGSQLIEKSRYDSNTGALID